MDVEKLIVDTFKRTVREMPIDRCTVADIARRTGLSRQAFYSHFEDKYALSIRIFEEDFAPVALACRERHMTWLESGRAHLAIYRNDKDFYRNVLSSRERCGLREYLNTRIYGEFRYKCLMRGMDPSDSDALYAVRMYTYTTNQVTVEWVEGGCVEPEGEIVRRFDLCRPLIISPYLADDDSYVPHSS